MKNLNRNRKFLQLRRFRRHIGHLGDFGVIRIPRERAWADAWPHLNDWFRPEADVIWRSKRRLITA